MVPFRLANNEVRRAGDVSRRNSHESREPVPRSDDLLSSHRNRQSDAQLDARTDRSKGTRGAIFVLSHATPSRTSVSQPVPDQPVSLEFLFAFRRRDRLRVEVAGVSGPWNTGGSAASEDMPRKPGTEHRERATIGRRKDKQNGQAQRRRGRHHSSIPQHEPVRPYLSGDPDSDVGSWSC
jgi:hypothetical protein